MRINENLFFYSTVKALKDMLIDTPTVWQNVSFLERFPECKYAGADYSGIGFVCPDVYAWDLYGDCSYDKGQWLLPDNIELSVRCTLDMSALQEAVVAAANAKGFDVHIISADYSYSEQEIARIYKTGSKVHKLFFAPFTAEKYLHLISLRPNTGQVDKEVRLLLLARKKQKHAPKTLKLAIDPNVLKSCIKAIEIRPHAGSQFNHPLENDIRNYILNDSLNTLSSLCPAADVKILKAPKYKKVKL